MKLKFDAYYKTLLLVLTGVVVWSCWLNAATVTNDVVPVAGTVDLTAQVVRSDNWLLTFGLDRVPPLRDTKVLGFPLWQYIASLIYIFLAFYISKAIDFLIVQVLKRWAKKTVTRFDDLLLELLHGPVKVIAFVILLHIGLEVFDWPAWVKRLLSKGLYVIVAISVTYMVLKAIDLLTTFWTRAKVVDDRSFNELLLPVLRTTLKVFACVVALLLTLSSLGLNITTLITSLGIGGLALSLAAQDTLANFFGAISIFIDKPFAIGDRIQLDKVDGAVESIGLRSTRVRNLDGHLITVPNKTMGNATITNITKRPNIKTIMNIGVTYDTPADKVKRATEILTEVYKAHPLTSDLVISFNAFADSSLNIIVIHWWGGTVYKDYLGGMHELNLQIKARFDAEKISFAFPTRTVYLRQDNEWRLAPAERALTGPKAGEATPGGGTLQTGA